MSESIEETTVHDTARQRLERARVIVDAGGIDAVLILIDKQVNARMRGHIWPGAVIVWLILTTLLGLQANADDLTLGAGSFKSEYSRDKGIVFAARPRGPWEYMATGTGRTGVAVMTHDHLLLQINHDAAIDERGWLQVVGRLRIELEGDPWSAAAQRDGFRMTHDLRRSVITVSANTEEGLVSIEIRAHMDRDVIRIDIRDGRATAGRITLAALTPGDGVTPRDGVEQDHSTPGAICLWHNNGNKTEWHGLNMASGMKDDSDFVDPLAGRCFGFTVQTDTKTKWKDGRLALPGAKQTVMHIAADSEIGEDRFHKTLAGRLAEKTENSPFIDTHEQWWKSFWDRVWFASDGSMIKHMTAYDMYRYFSAVASGKEREFPVRFQIALLRSTLRREGWLQMHINSVQTVEAYYPMFKNGDWDQLSPLLDYYQRTRPFYKRFCKDLYGHPGLVIPYEHNMWGSAHYYLIGDRKPSYRSRFKDREFYPILDSPYLRYSFEHSVALMQLALDIAEAKGDRVMVTDLVLPYMHEMCLFFNNHYKKADGRIVFDPATSGETWYNVRNPSSWIFLFKSFLPRVIVLARKHDLEKLVTSATELLKSLPDVPRGKWRSDEEVFLPAEVFDRHEPINAENPELYGIWPYGALGVGMSKYDIALRSYQGRLWKNGRNGWALDCIWAARLGLTEEVLKDYDAIHFPATLRSPGGFSYEAAPTWREEPSLPLYPSMQGMGTSVCHLYEMICQDRGDGILVLPAWPPDKPLRMAMYSAVAGRVEIEYEPGKPPRVITERPVPVRRNGPIQVPLPKGNKPTGDE